MVGLKEVFDRTHMVKTPTGKAYVNENAEKIAVRTFSIMPLLFLYDLTEQLAKETVF